MRPATPAVPTNPMRYGTNARRVPSGDRQVPAVGGPLAPGVPSPEAERRRAVASATVAAAAARRQAMRNQRQAEIAAIAARRGVPLRGTAAPRYPSPRTPGALV